MSNQTSKILSTFTTGFSTLSWIMIPIKLISQHCYWCYYLLLLHLVDSFVTDTDFYCWFLLLILFLDQNHINSSPQTVFVHLVVLSTHLHTLSHVYSHGSWHILYYRTVRTITIWCSLSHRTWHSPSQLDISWLDYNIHYCALYRDSVSVLLWIQ